MSLSPTAPAPAIIAYILERLCFAVGGRARQGVSPLVLMEAWRRISAIRRRFALLAEQIRAGTLRPARPRPPRPPRPADAPGPRARPARPRRGPALPRRFGWLIGLVPCDAATRRSQLQHQFDNNPEMAALLAAAPHEMGRLLRPLCHMLGMQPPEVLRLPERARAAGDGAAGEAGAGEAGAGEAGAENAAPRPPRPRKQRARKLRWRMAKMPPECGLIFY
jgi:hypothetical protein